MSEPNPENGPNNEDAHDWSQMEEYVQDILRDLNENGYENGHTLDEDDSENAHTPDEDVPENEHTPNEDVSENAHAPDEVVPPAPTTPDRPIQQHPSPPPVDAMDLDNEPVANTWGSSATGRMADMEQLVGRDIWDFISRQPGPQLIQFHDPRSNNPDTPVFIINAGNTVNAGNLVNTANNVHIVNIANASNANSEPLLNRARLRAVSRYRCQTCHRWTGRTRATQTERTIWVSNASCYYCTWAVSWSLATDETPDLRQTLVNVEDHVQSGREELQREEDEAYDRADLLRNRMLATQHNTEGVHLRRLGWAQD